MPSATMVEAQRERLIERGRRIEREFAQHEEAITQDIATPGDLSHAPTHLADRDVPGLDVEVAVGQSHDALLDAIRGALKRINQGTYGQCERCGKEISQERLKALPYVACCIDCENRG